MSKKLSEIFKEAPFSLDRVGKSYVKSINKSKTNEQNNRRVEKSISPRKKV